MAALARHAEKRCVHESRVTLSASYGASNISYRNTYLCSLNLHAHHCTVEDEVSDAKETVDVGMTTPRHDIGPSSAFVRRSDQVKIEVLQLQSWT